MTTAERLLIRLAAAILWVLLHPDAAKRGAGRQKQLDLLTEADIEVTR